MTAPGEQRLDRAETCKRLAVDRARLAALFGQRARVPRLLWLTPSYLCVCLYRVARLLYVSGHTLAARLVWQLNMFLTGADISPICDIGPGFVVVHPVSVTVVGSAGRNLTIEGLGGMGSGFGLQDIGAGPGLPLLGDDVEMARGAMVLGPVRIGDRVRLGPGLTVVRDVAADNDVPPHGIRITRSTRAAASADDAS